MVVTVIIMLQVPIGKRGYIPIRTACFNWMIGGIDVSLRCMNLVLASIVLHTHNCKAYSRCSDVSLNPINLEIYSWPVTCYLCSARSSCLQYGDV